MEMLNVKVNGIAVSVPKGKTRSSHCRTSGMSLRPTYGSSAKWLQRRIGVELLH